MLVGEDFDMSQLGHYVDNKTFQLVREASGGRLVVIRHIGLLLLHR